MSEMTVEERRKFERMAPAVHVEYKKGQWLNRIIEVMQQKGDPVKLAEDMAQREVALEQESIRDPLTGLFNRSYIGASLRREIALAEKHDWGIGLAFLDPDHFKEINDQEPKKHSAGDETLKTLAIIMKQVAGEDAIIGRWTNGDEFVIILTDTDQEKMKQIGVNLGMTIKRRLAREANLQRAEVTASIGMTMYKKGETVVEFVGRADTTMYQAKETGRSRLAIENPDGQREVILIE